MLFIDVYFCVSKLVCSPRFLFQNFSTFYSIVYVCIFVALSLSPSQLYSKNSNTHKMTSTKNQIAQNNSNNDSSLFLSEFNPFKRGERMKTRN